MATDPERAIYNAFKAVIDADTGAGGLSEVGGDDAIRGEFLVFDDVAAATYRLVPFVRFRAIVGELNPDRVDAVVRLFVHEDQQRTRDDVMGGVVYRLRTLFNNPASGTMSIMNGAADNWTLSKPKIVRTIPLDTDNEENVRLMEFSVVACKE